LPILTLIIKPTRSSETPVLRRATRIHIPEYGSLHSHSRENFRSCIWVSEHEGLEHQEFRVVSGDNGVSETTRENA
jgi:hypothetical protein